MEMIKTIKMISILTLVFMLMISTNLPVNAHTAKQSNRLKSEHGDVGGESAGWNIDEGEHTADKYLFYSWKTGDACLNTARKNLFLQGAAKWAPFGSITEDPSGGGNLDQTGKLGTYDGGTSTAMAKYYDYKSDAEGHLKTWKIELNWRKTPVNNTTAHEFGHVFGLDDLYESFNSDQLMYGYATGTATEPKAADIEGFKFKPGLYPSHSYNISGVCTVCGRLKK